MRRSGARFGNGRGRMKGADCEDSGRGRGRGCEDGPT